MVLTRREGASFVLDPTSHRMHLRYQVLPASFPAFPAPSPANDSARVSLRWFMPYTTPANFPASYSLTNSFSPNTRMQFVTYAYTIPLHEYILQCVWKIYHRSRILRPAFFIASYNGVQTAFDTSALLATVQNLPNCSRKFRVLLLS